MGSSSKKRSKKHSNSDSEIDSYDDDDYENKKIVQGEETYDVDDCSNKGSDDDDENNEESEEEEKDDNESSEQDEMEDLGNGNGGDYKAAEMEELEEEYRSLHHQEQNILENLKRHKDEDLLKGQAVRNQKALWDKILEVRFLLQKSFSNSNRLPKDPIRSSFCDSDVGVNSDYLDLIESSEKTLASMLELQEALLEKNPSIAQATEGKHERTSNSYEAPENSNKFFDLEWIQISQMHKRMASFRDKSINKWQRKTQLTTGAAAMKSKLRAFNQDISDQVASYMRDPSRMIKQMQHTRSSVAVFGNVSDVQSNTKGDLGEEAHPGTDPELLDDSEFYQQLLKEFFESIDPNGSETAFYAIKRLQPKKRKIVDRRASKSRKIRYNVHEKLINFMAPQPMNLPPVAPKLFENLFGLKTQRPASAAS